MILFLINPNVPVPPLCETLRDYPQAIVVLQLSATLDAPIMDASKLAEIGAVLVANRAVGRSETNNHALAAPINFVSFGGAVPARSRRLYRIRDPT